MKAEQNTYMYSFDFPDGKIFLKDEEIPDSFVDTPVKLGITRSMTKAEIKKICDARKGEKTVFETEESSKEDESELEAIRQEYEMKLGVKPHHRKSIETMKTEINAS